MLTQPVNFHYTTNIQVPMVLLTFLIPMNTSLQIYIFMDVYSVTISVRTAKLEIKKLLITKI